MKKLTKSTLTILRRAIGYGLLVVIASVGTIVAFALNQCPDLQVWHEADLDEEFDSKSDVKDFEAYLKLEERLFAQLEEKVYGKTPPGDNQTINRFQKGSIMDPTNKATNWNRTSQLEQDNPTAGVLLLHGLSDSPYSLRHFGEKFHQAGASVIGLRILDHLQEFLLELGDGFCFEDRQKKIRIGQSDHFVDLVFYHRKLHCHVLIELKTEAFSHANSGQLNTYLNYYRKHEMAEGDNPPVGLLLCTDKDHTLVEYALGGMDENLFVSAYKVALPKQEELKAFLLRQSKDFPKS